MSTITITGSNTFATLTFTAGDTINITISTTQTITSAFNSVGTLGNLVTLKSTSGGTAATLSSASATINARYMAIKDSTATGGVTWTALTSINNGGNTGWTFSGPPPSFNTSLITAVARVQQGLSVPRFIMGGLGGSGATTFGLFKQSTSYLFNLWRSKPFVIGKPFRIVSISFGLSAPVASGMLIVPVLNFDNDRKVVYGNNIDTTKYPNGETYITLTADNFQGNVMGKKNFSLEFDFQGTTLVAIELPVTIIIEPLDIATSA